MKYRLDPTAPQGISKDDDKIVPYFQDRVGKPSLIDSVNGKHGAVQIVGGTNVTVDNSGQAIKISASGGGGGGAVDSVNGQTGTVVLNTDDIDDTSSSHKYVTSSDLTTLSNTSGTNTGDQDLSGYALTSSLAAVATSGDYGDLTNTPTIPSTFDDLSDGTTNKAFTSTLKDKLDGIESGAQVNTVDSVNGQTGAVSLDADDVLPAQSGNSGKYLTTDGSAASWATLSGGGDMAASVYDPQGVEDDAFDRANHTGTQAASTISDFDTEVSNNTDVAANTAARHAAVTVTDSSEIDFTLTGQDITASLKTGSIDESKLDTSVNASLDLADSAVQPGGLAAVATSGDYDDLSNTPSIPSTFDDLSDGTTNKAYTSSEQSKLSGIETGADVTDATNVAAAGAVMESDTSTASMSFVIDEDDMSSDSATKVPTQQSVKAYVDANSGGSGSGDVVGPASSTDNAIALFDGTTGKVIKETADLTVTSGEATIKARNGKDMTLVSGASGNIYLTAEDLLVVSNSNLRTNAVDERSAGSGVTIDGVLIKDGEVDGVDIAALETTVGGKITGFADPNADRIVFWDDSAGAYAALTASTGLSISGTNMTVRTSSASQTGIVELATDAETTTGTDTTRAITPANLTSQIGTRIQAYDADLTSWASKTAPSGAAVGTTDTQTLTGKTINGPDNTLTNIGSNSINFGGGGAGIWWEEIGRASNTNQGSITVSSLPAKNYLKALISFDHSTSLTSSIRFNGDSGNNYAWNSVANYGAVTSVNTTNKIDLVPSVSSANNRFYTLDIQNIKSIKTLHYKGIGDSAVTSNVGSWQGDGAWSGATVSSITLLASTGNLGTAEIIVLGHD